MADKIKKLYLSEADKKWAGVCGGIAEYFDTDATVIRIIWVAATVFSGFFPGLIAYLVCAVIIPKKV